MTECENRRWSDGVKRRVLVGWESGVRLELQSHLPPPAWVMEFRFSSQKQSHDCRIRSSYPASTWGFVMLLQEANKLVSAVANKRRSYVKYLDYTKSWHAAIEQLYPLGLRVFSSTENWNLCTKILISLQAQDYQGLEQRTQMKVLSLRLNKIVKWTLEINSHNWYSHVSGIWVTNETGLDLMNQFIRPLYNWLHQFTDHHLILCHLLRLDTLDFWPHFTTPLVCCTPSHLLNVPLS